MSKQVQVYRCQGHAKWTPTWSSDSRARAGQRGGARLASSLRAQLAPGGGRKASSRPRGPARGQGHPHCSVGCLQGEDLQRPPGTPVRSFYLFIVSARHTHAHGQIPQVLRGVWRRREMDLQVAVGAVGHRGLRWGKRRFPESSPAAMEPRAPCPSRPPTARLGAWAVASPGDAPGRPGRTRRREPPGRGGGPGRGPGWARDWRSVLSPRR